MDGCIHCANLYCLTLWDCLGLSYIMGLPGIVLHCALCVIVSLHTLHYGMGTVGLIAESTILFAEDKIFKRFDI